MRYVVSEIDVSEGVIAHINKTKVAFVNSAVHDPVQWIQQDSRGRNAVLVDSWEHLEPRSNTTELILVNVNNWDVDRLLITKQKRLTYNETLSETR